jgi:periplasmic divalent cation tolerance protein
VSTSSGDKPIIIFTTVPSQADAVRVSEDLLSKHLVACVTAFPVTSRYVWNGKLEESSEIKLMLKTTQDMYGDVERALVSAHTFDVPEILAVNVDSGLGDYLGWMRTAINAKTN